MDPQSVVAAHGERHRLERVLAGSRRRRHHVAQHGANSVTGLEKALLIRAWLASVQHEYSFVLLIGDANPDYGEIPMVTVWPRHEYPPDNCGGFGLDCRSMETDYLYADLSGDWDLNGNGLYGETDLDEGPGGMDFEAELYVGRIPTYFENVVDLDQVLLHAIHYMNQTPDALPAMAVTAIFAEGETSLVNVPQARSKETDRISAMATELKKLGVKVEELPDGLIIHRSRPKPASLHGWVDHRIVMALSIAAMAIEGKCCIDTAEAVSVTFPRYVELMNQIGANINVEKGE